MFSSRTGSSALIASEKSAEEKEQAMGDVEAGMGAGVAGIVSFLGGRVGGVH